MRRVPRCLSCVLNARWRQNPLAQPTSQWSSEQVTPNEGGLLPAPRRPDTPVAVRFLVAITHTFRHIFWPQLATTSNKFPVVRNRRSRCSAMVSTTSDSCRQVSSPNQRVRGSSP